MENLSTLLASLGLETGGMRKVTYAGMELQVRYDPYLESVSLGTGERSHTWYLLDESSGGIVGMTPDHRVVHVAVSSEMLPLRGPYYDPTTDVMTLRDPSRGLETPGRVIENGPLVGYLALATSEAEDYHLIGLDIRLASVWFGVLEECMHE